MVFSKSELGYREQLKDKITAICRRRNMIVYGSFCTGNFHFNIRSKETFSDLDLICEDPYSETEPESIKTEVRENTGLDIHVSVRSNSKHVSSLPKAVSRNLSAVDTSLILYKEEKITDEYFSYLVSKYILRTVYSDVYFNSNIAKSMHLIPSLGDDPVFTAVSMNKLQGKVLSPKSIEAISQHKIIKSREIVDGLMVLCRTCSIADMEDYWKEFIDNANKCSLHDLADDLSHKVSNVLKNPNKCFNSDSQTRRSLSLALGLSAG